MPTCPVCGEHAYAGLRAIDAQFNAVGLYRCHGPDGRYYIHPIEWPDDVPTVMLSPADQEQKSA